MILAGLNVIVNSNMGKKRKTRKEKIILQLKRELAKERAKIPSPSKKVEARQEAISPESKIKPQRKLKEKNADISILSYDPRLIRKDLLKTLILTSIAISLELVLYFRLR